MNTNCLNCMQRQQHCTSTPPSGADAFGVSVVCVGNTRHHAPRTYLDEPSTFVEPTRRRNFHSFPNFSRTPRGCPSRPLRPLPTITTLAPAAPSLPSDVRRFQVFSENFGGKWAAQQEGSFRLNKVLDPAL